MIDAGKIRYISRGQYDPAAKYEPLDIVLYGSSLWEPKKETTGNPPPGRPGDGDAGPVAENEYWKLFLPGGAGPQGKTGPQGQAAGFGMPAATVDANTGIPSVTVTASGPDTEKVFQFEFHNLKGEPGAEGVIDENSMVMFPAAETRENIQSGETLAAILGKIEKVVADLKQVAFSGNYGDLEGKPTVPEALPSPHSLRFTGASAAFYDGSADETVDIPEIPASLPADGGNADTVGNKNLEYIMDYENLENKPEFQSVIPGFDTIEELDQALEDGLLEEGAVAMVLDDGRKIGKIINRKFVPCADLGDEMAGATDTGDGKAGLVPAPAAGDVEKFLRGDGTWAAAGNSNIYDSDEFMKNVYICETVVPVDLLKTYNNTKNAYISLKMQCRRLLDNGDNVYLKNRELYRIIPFSSVMYPMLYSSEYGYMLPAEGTFYFDWVSALYKIGVSIYLTQYGILFHNQTNSDIASGAFYKVFTDMGVSNDTRVYIAIIGLNTGNWSIRDGSGKTKYPYFIQTKYFSAIETETWGAYS